MGGRASPAPWSRAQRPRPECSTHFTEGSQATSAQGKEPTPALGLSPPKRLQRPLSPGPSPPPHTGRRGLPPQLQPQAYPSLLRGDLRNCPMEVPVVLREAASRTAEAHPESASAPGCPQAGLTQSSWAVRAPPGPCAFLETWREGPPGTMGLAPPGDRDSGSGTHSPTARGLGIRGRALRRGHSEVGRKGWCPLHHADTDSPRKQPHLGQQVLTPTALSHAPGGTRGWAAAPSWGHCLPLNAIPWAAPTLAGPAPAPQVPPQGPVRGLIHSEGEPGTPHPLMPGAARPVLRGRSAHGTGGQLLGQRGGRGVGRGPRARGRCAALHCQ